MFCLLFVSKTNKGCIRFTGAAFIFQSLLFTIFRIEIYRDQQSQFTKDSTKLVAVITPLGIASAAWNSSAASEGYCFIYRRVTNLALQELLESSSILVLCYPAGMYFCLPAFQIWVATPQVPVTALNSLFFLNFGSCPYPASGTVVDTPSVKAIMSDGPG